MKVALITHGSLRDYAIDTFARHPKFGSIVCLPSWGTMDSLSYREIPIVPLWSLNEVNYDAIIIMLKDFYIFQGIFPQAVSARRDEQVDVLLVSQMCIENREDFILNGNFNPAYVRNLPASTKGLDVAMEMLPLKRKLEKIRFQVELAGHCNLKCRGCTHFSPLVEQEFLSVEEFKRDIQRLGDLFDHECETINLMGGEPLLHPEIRHFMGIARENFMRGRIAIYTNGILLPQMKEDFWQACHDYDVQIRLTRYPIKLDVDKIKALTMKFSVDFQWNQTTETQTRDDSWLINPLSLEGTSDARRNFLYCFKPTACIELRHGKLFICDIAAHVQRFNKQFGENIPVAEEDYVDIYHEKDKEAILNKLRRAIPICRYCDREHWHHVPWGISKREMSEWVLDRTQN